MPDYFGTYFDSSYFDTAAASPYFASYFDSAYFDAESAAVQPSIPRGGGFRPRRRNAQPEPVNTEDWAVLIL